MSELPILAHDDADPERRATVKLMAGLPLAALGLEFERAEEFAEHAHQAVQRAAATKVPFTPRFFTSDEWRMVRSLADYVIPRDRRSGSATDAAVPEFMDFIMMEYPTSQRWMRDGLGWVNGACRARFGAGWISATDAQRRALLDVIAFPKTAPAAMKPGADFFTRFRDLTSSGFWTSRIGVRDIGYRGNQPMASWPGCPPEQLKRYGVSYAQSMHVPGREP
ncbi:MAG: gluconate 2-dehydrogenase subunit 3 family protein [Gemmatimonadaceae bacterium]|nr:gluconate 2-dehydrogenase subunit 3 family protein [Gemmatimonadaceae bacterium]